MSQKEKRIRSITSIYYSNPKVQNAIFVLSKNREVIPRYFEGFGKRPDTLQYPTDIMSLVNKGATSFHASEEIWQDPLQINSDMSSSELSEIRKSWDLLIDIDSPFLDYSKIAARLIIEEIENHGVKNYGIKFSGSKGFHIVVPAEAFPKEFEEKETRKMFPEWPRAISQYLMYKIRQKYNKEVTKLDINFQALQERTKLSKEDVTETICPNCGESAKKGQIIIYQCPECKTVIERKLLKMNKRKLSCIQNNCPGYLEKTEEKEYFFCDNCGFSSQDKKFQSDKKVIYSREMKKEIEKYSEDFEEQISGHKIASLDLVLVAPRHLIRMPYSLHEKTTLASVVIKKEQLASFSPKDANPMKIRILDFYPEVEKGEATHLLESAISWKKTQDTEGEEIINKKYKKYEKIDVKGVSEDLFPKPIKKLLKGLQDGRKRGLFVLLTFLRTLNFPPEYLNKKIREWNDRNDPPLKEGYVKSQIDWHLRQKRQILPPNYKNDSFYKDLNLIEDYPREKNPIVEVLRKVRRKEN